MENKYNRSIKALNADRKEECISEKLKSICNKKNIIIKYVAPYIHKKNGLVEQS